jgi:hypothetical protein
MKLTNEIVLRTLKRLQKQQSRLSFSATEIAYNIRDCFCNCSEVKTCCFDLARDGKLNISQFSFRSGISGGYDYLIDDLAVEFRI